MRDNLEEKFRDRFADFKVEPEEDFLAKIHLRVREKKYLFYRKLFFRVFSALAIIFFITLNGELFINESGQFLSEFNQKKSQSIDNQFINRKNDLLRTESNKPAEFKKISGNEFYQSTHHSLTNASQNSNRYANKSPVQFPPNKAGKLESQLYVADNQIITPDSSDSNVKPNCQTKNETFEAGEIAGSDSIKQPNEFQKTGSVARPKTEKPTRQKEQKIRKNRFFASVMPLMSYYHIRPNRDDAVVVENIDAGEVFSWQRFGFKWQMGGIIALQKRTFLRSTVAISQFQQKWSYTLVGKQPDNESNEIIHQQKIWYAGLQGDILYQLKPLKSFNHHLISGFNLNFPISERNNSTNLMWQLGYGLSRPIKHNFILYWEPNLQISFNRYKDPNNYVKIRPFYWGFNLGMLFQ